MLTVFLFALFMLINFITGSFFVCILLSLSYIMMISGLYKEEDEKNKVPGIIGLLFGAIYSALIIIVYFTQCTTVLNETLSEDVRKVLDYLEYVLDLLNEFDGITYKKMMGEFLLYKNNIIFGGIYDNRFLIKKNPLLDKYNLKEEIPYPGAKPMFSLDIYI